MKRYTEHYRIVVQESNIRFAGFSHSSRLSGAQRGFSRFAFENTVCVQARRPRQRHADLGLHAAMAGIGRGGQGSPTALQCGRSASAVSPPCPASQSVETSGRIPGAFIDRVSGSKSSRIHLLSPFVHLQGGGWRRSLSILGATRTGPGEGHKRRIEYRGCRRGASSAQAASTVGSVIDQHASAFIDAVDETTFRERARD